MRKNEGIKGRGNDWTHISESAPIKQFSTHDDGILETAFKSPLQIYL